MLEDHGASWCMCAFQRFSKSFKLFFFKDFFFQRLLCKVLFNDFSKTFTYLSKTLFVYVTQRSPSKDSIDTMLPEFGFHIVYNAQDQHQ